MLLVCVPILALWLHMESIFAWLGQDSEITHIAQVYMVFSILELFAQACLHPLKIFSEDSARDHNPHNTLCLVGAPALAHQLLLGGLLGPRCESNPKALVAAMGILIQMTGLLYTFLVALSSGLSAYIGQALGASHPSQGQLISIIGIAVAVAFGLTTLIFMIAIRLVWGRIYTDDPQVLKLVSTALSILGLCELGNSPQTASCGVLTRTARPNIGACINLFSFYLFGLPIAVLMTFEFKLGFCGLWFGLLAS
ncbi:hypothetical protein NL676_018761 [Syzygium grande]|nr:hypothetical protein NL676_018761 [Syzygium grande]